MIEQLEQLRIALTELLADIDDVSDGKLPEISAATLTRARQVARAKDMAAAMGLRK